MELMDFKDSAEKLIDDFENLIHQMPQKGNKSCDCQRTFLQQRLNELSYAVNGTEQVDLEEDSEEE